MKRVGAHVSISGGVQNAPLNAIEIGARAFGMFTKNQRQWKAKPITRNEVEQFKKNCKTGEFLPEHILPHVGYLINLGNPEKEGLDRSRTAFIDEMERCQQLGLKYLNFHPGSHKNLIPEFDCLKLIAESINLTLDKTEGVTAVIESTAGQGGHVGYRFEHLSTLIDAVEDKTRIGVCLDTAHIFAAGYDLRTPQAYEDTMAQFEKIVGFEYLKGFHLNDSKAKFASRVDRHNSLGKGELGLEPFGFIMKDPRLEEIPLILETIDETLWPEEIKLLYSFLQD
jgi:deoxyribonuclease-4